MVKGKMKRKETKRHRPEKSKRKKNKPGRLKNPGTGIKKKNQTDARSRNLQT
jgi:hypothetical protein